MSKKLGISNNTLINWEQGKDSPKISQFRRLCEMYGVREDDIFLH